MADNLFSKPFAVETWTMYSVGMVLVVLRYISRIRRFGIRNLQVDDYVMANGVVWYTILCVAFNQIAVGGGSNLMSQEDIDALTPEIEANRVAGSKWVFVSEHSMILTIWSMKVCMLVLYASITEGLKQRKWVTYVAIYTGFSFVGSELALFLVCRPIGQYWAVPAANAQCSTYQIFEIVNGCLSIPGDIAILLIGIPILVAIRLPVQQKAVLLVIFGMGGFVIVAAILTKVYCLVPSLISYVYMNWYFREASVAVYVTNLPTIWPLLRDIFPSLQTWGTKQGKSSGENGVRYTSSEAKDYELRSYKKGPKAESQERINDTDSENGSDQHAINIQRDISITVKSERDERRVDDISQRNWRNQKGTTVVSTVQ